MTGWFIFNKNIIVDEERTQFGSMGSICKSD